MHPLTCGCRRRLILGAHNRRDEGSDEHADSDGQRRASADPTHLAGCGVCVHCRIRWRANEYRCASVRFAVCLVAVRCASAVRCAGSGCSQTLGQTKKGWPLTVVDALTGRKLSCTSSNRIICSSRPLLRGGSVADVDGRSARRQKPPPLWAPSNRHRAASAASVTTTTRPPAGEQRKWREQQQRREG